MTQRLIIFEIHKTLACKLGPGQLTSRPYLGSFLDFMFNNFKIAVWTSEIIPKECISDLFGKHFKNLLFVWGQSECKKIDIEEKVFYYKPLKYVWKSDIGKGFSKSNTLLVDSIGSGIGNPAKTLFHPEIWACDMYDNSLKKNGEIMTWFNMLNNEKGSLQQIIKRGD